MEFKKSNYKKKDRIKFNKNMKFLSGSGGSQNLIFISNNYVYKIIPFYNKRFNLRKQRKNHDQMEIKIYDILTKEFILTNKTPHIVGFYDKYKINISDIFDKCPSLQEELTKKNPFNNLYHQRICKFKNDLKNGILKKKADVIAIEKCTNTIDNFIKDLLKSNIKNKYIKVGKFIDLVSFQIIFTLAVIQDKYPTFVHNDFFLRNILGSVETKYKSNEYIEYNFKNKKFYLPANGFYSKINDFGEVLSKPKMISTNIFFKSREFNQEKIDCNKCDIFNFFHDLYDGADMGSMSLKTLMKRKSEKNKKYIRNVMKKYIDVSLIDKINKTNKRKLNWIWYIKDIKFLENSIKTPVQYLKSDIFKKYTKLPKNAIIIKSFGL